MTLELLVHMGHPLDDSSLSPPPLTDSTGIVSPGMAGWMPPEWDHQLLLPLSASHAGSACCITIWN
eukprot:CAMPEP_0173379150 /NCGR_PEP_ID=MMETSP1356-20130122/2210_1 /TAXON_ID=77927 ORGANISM="Hemiselmis virescens, Strain PCC157" /NCGR_SAMPLE_ID=MMETSP1356 /ASSEMBLY_ACC=CAM_ASM_000847 /LENGTH=65 /DNA_ID=CAMNT_0014332439 /DNA_START=211 /DNA_END=405 /DNA_ORIENTATION=+